MSVQPTPTQPQKKSRWGLWFGLAVVIVLLLCGGVAITGLVGLNKAVSDANAGMQKPGKVSGAAVPTASAQAVKKTEIKTHAAGEVASFTGENGLTGTMSVSAGKMINGEYGGRFLVVTVDMAVSAGELNYNPFDFKLKATDGTEHDVDFSGADSALQSGTLTAGRKVKGTLSFKADDSLLPGAEVEYAPGLFGAIAYWKVG